MTNTDEKDQSIHISIIFLLELSMKLKLRPTIEVHNFIFAPTNMKYVQ